MSAHVCIYDPARLETPPYDSVADTGGVAVPKLVLDSGPGGALVQPIRSATRVVVGNQPNAILGIRFQIKASAPIEDGTTLRAGLILRVVDGGESSDLAPLTYSLTETVDSSLRWDRIIEAVVLTGG